MITRLSWATALCAVAACSTGGNEGLGGNTPSAGNSGSGNGNTVGNGAPAPATGSGFGDQTAVTGAGGGCAAVSQEAKPEIKPADIIFAVDTSGSMDAEKGWVQDHLNQFATIITQVGIDARVVMISHPDVCIAAPLGSGQCGGADEKLPAYRHVTTEVGSKDALRIFLSAYPQYKDQLRPNASKIFVVVTDDNSDMSAADFTNQLLALDPPTFQDFKFEGIFAFTPPLDCFGFQCPVVVPPNPCCFNAGVCLSYSAAEGSVYKQLVAQTMGVQGDLCGQNFGPVFTDIANNVIQSSPLACDFAIPPPPAGQIFDLNKVNVQYAPAGQNPAAVLNVPGGLPACSAMGGWYYDDPQNPSRVILCPATCETIQADTKAKIDVLFGCETMVVPA